jgi:hypothetical protein
VTGDLLDVASIDGTRVESELEMVTAVPWRVGPHTREAAATDPR